MLSVPVGLAASVLIIAGCFVLGDALFGDDIDDKADPKFRGWVVLIGLGLILWGAVLANVVYTINWRMYDRGQVIEALGTSAAWELDSR